MGVSTFFLVRILLSANISIHEWLKKPLIDADELGWNHIGAIRKAARRVFETIL